MQRNRPFTFLIPNTRIRPCRAHKSDVSPYGGFSNKKKKGCWKKKKRLRQSSPKKRRFYLVGTRRCPFRPSFGCSGARKRSVQRAVFPRRYSPRLMPSANEGRPGRAFESKASEQNESGRFHAEIGKRRSAGPCAAQFPLPATAPTKMRALERRPSSATRDSGSGNR